MKPRAVPYLTDEEGKRFFGPGPFELLDRVRETHSLSAAAKQMGMSYTKAMRIVHDAEKALGFALTTREIGGMEGGGSRLTTEGEALLDRYDLWREETTREANSAFSVAFAGLAGTPRLGCVVMASGEAQRFGRQKLVEPFAGRKVLERTLDALVSPRLDVVVVTRWEAVAHLAELHHVACVTPTGPLQSDTVRAGMEALGERAGYLFVQGDQPLLRSASVEAMLDQFAAHPHSVVRLAWQGKPSSPVIFPAEFADALRSLEGDVGGGEILRRNPDLLASARLVEAASEVEVADIDTPSDLQRLESMMEEEPPGGRTGGKLGG